jgi:hypothetical protein
MGEGFSIAVRNIAAALQPGTSFGKFRILHELGRGGMGIVYAAEDTLLKRTVALKLLHPALSLDDGFVQRFQKEARAVAALSHPNIVKIHSFDTIHDCLTLETEFVAAGSLATVLESQPVSAFRMVSLTRDILQALAHCHRAGLVHRDVKPSNVLIGEDGRALLTDFGIAKAAAGAATSLTDQTQTTGLFLGTPRYAPPEAWQGELPTPGWDFYSLGVLMYEALSGRTPYPATTLMELAKQMATAVPEPLHEIAPQVSKPLSRFVHRLMSPEADKRPADAAEALAALAEVPEARVEYQPTAPTVVGPVAPTRMRAWRGTARRAFRRTAALLERPLAVALLTVGALALLYRLASWPEEPRPPRSSAATFALQSAFAPAALPSVAELLDARKDGTVQRSVYTTALIQPTDGENPLLPPDAVGPAHQQPGPDWLLTEGREGRPDVILAQGSMELWRLELTTGAEGSLRLVGHWAAHGDPSGNVFLNGEVSGAGSWLGADRAMLAATLRFHCEQDGSTWWVSLLAQRREPPMADARFLHALEASPVLQPLIHNQLLLRKLPWAAALEAQLPSMDGGRVTVPLLTDGAVEVDGALAEPLWRTTYYDGAGPIGRLRGRPHALQPEMLLRSLPDALCLALRAKVAPPPGYRLEVVLLRRFILPAAESTRWAASYENGEIEARIHAGGEVKRWSCPWTIAARVENAFWQAELRIPYGSIPDPGIAGPAPHPEQRWRLNVELRAPGDASGAVPLVRWGFPDVEAVEHGAVLAFAESESTRSKGDVQP